MSDRAVAELLRQWDEGSNAFLRMAAGQVRSAMREAPSDQKTCDMCGRKGVKAYVAGSYEGQWFCSNESACDRRVDALAA